MPDAAKTLKAIDEVLELTQDSSHRTHLGASLIGDECARKLWYIFRWVKIEKHDGKLLRLFNRGHLEESRFVGWLRSIDGVQVWEEDSDGNQFKINGQGGHFGGSLDGVATGLPDFAPGEPVLLEFKTHGEKSFTMLAGKLEKGIRIKPKGVADAKWQHYVQMQIYMHKMGFKWALYMAINKNTDEIYVEAIEYNQQVAEQYIQRAGGIIFSAEAPARISNTPGWWQCKFCSYRANCFGKDIPDMNCRTCDHVKPLAIDKGWQCELTEQRVDACEGCPDHVFNPNLINGVTILKRSKKENWLLIQMPNGDKIKHGPNHATGEDLWRNLNQTGQK